MDEYSDSVTDCILAPGADPGPWPPGPRPGAQVQNIFRRARVRV
jgi:hypothetical protein